MRFASLERVSTKRQEEHGESLPVQRRCNAEDVERLGGTLVARYGGQEHATPSWERKEFDRLLGDAGKGLWDALIVHHTDRWSRDNARSKEGLAVLRKHKIKFYVGTTFKDLHKSAVCFELGMGAEVGEFVAMLQQEKMFESKIARARKGRPAIGGRHGLPVGRTWDKKSGTWGLDAAKAGMYRDIAARFLKGESLYVLSRAYGMSYSTICRNLRENMGPVWVQHFDSDRLNVHEEVPTPVPAILDEDTIRAIHKRLDANRTFYHDAPRVVHPYLLRGFLFCDGCDRALTGAANRWGTRYYRHAHGTYVRLRKSEPCPYCIPRKPHVRADLIENVVVSELFRLHGSPAAVERSIREALPQADEARRQLAHLEAELAKLDGARNRILDLVESEALTNGQATAKLNDIKEREGQLRADLDKVRSQLANVPTEEAIQRFLAWSPAGQPWQPGMPFWVQDADGNEYPGGNGIGSLAGLVRSHEDQRKLVESVFTRPGAGVYLTPEGKGGFRWRMEGLWTFTLEGRCREQSGTPRRSG
jgi:DNA invertase Pin-like site-specific DNA recombinase